MILGTHTSGEEQDYLMIANVRLPSEDAEIDARKYNDAKGGASCRLAAKLVLSRAIAANFIGLVQLAVFAEVGGFGGTPAKVDIAIRIPHEGEVNRARYCPQQPFLIATKSPCKEVCRLTTCDWLTIPLSLPVTKSHFRGLLPMRPCRFSSLITQSIHPSLKGSQW